MILRGRLLTSLPFRSSLTHWKSINLRVAYMSSPSAPSKENHDITKWASKDGHFRRQPSTFRDMISTQGEFAPEKGRYHLYVRYA